MKFFACAALFALALTLPAHAEPPVPPAIADQSYHLVRDWDFSRGITSLTDLRRDFYTRYASNNGTQDHLNDEWEVYRDNNNHVFKDGALHLVARAPGNRMQKGVIESGMIRSKWTGLYGYFEARMKMPQGRGMWPAFWFANEYWPPEIDVVEVVNNAQVSSANSFHNVHGKYAGELHNSKLDGNNSYHPGFDFADGFHTFAAEWTPSSVKYYVDDVPVVEKDFEWRHDNGKLGEPVPVVINLAVGGSWPGPPVSLSDFPASLDIAYIRVWQKE